MFLWKLPNILSKLSSKTQILCQKASVFKHNMKKLGNYTKIIERSINKYHKPNNIKMKLSEKIHNKFKAFIYYCSSKHNQHIN